MTHIVMTASAHMPSSCKGTYRRVAVVEVADPANPPKMISERAKGVVKIVRIWERLNVGKTTKCAYAVAFAEANALAAELNREHVI